MKNPESMRPTPASKAIIMKEANEVVFHAAQQVISEEKRNILSTHSRQLLIRATKFLSGK